MGKQEVLPKRLDILDVNDKNCQFRINIDVLNEAFGVGRSMYAKAVYPDKKHSSIPGNNGQDKFIIWMPKLYSNSSEWKNCLSDDGTKIYEIAETTKKQDWTEIDKHDLYCLKITFVRSTRKGPYRFVGVFRADKMDHLHHIYDRVSTKVKLIGNPVHTIELLDDIRKE